jgi:hypothetical protein
MNALKNNTETMKKIYIQPEVITSLRYEMEKPLCGSGDRLFSIGNNDENNQYSNGDWFNQGWNTPTERIENDNGVLNSSTKSRGADWGTIW